MAVRAEPIDRLRDDVRLLGELVGDVLREQGGPELFEAVEHIRTAAIALRNRERLGRGAARVGRSASRRARLLQLVRAFSVYFHLINLAEQHHRVRTLRERQRQSTEPLHESVAAADRRADRRTACRCETVQDVLRELRGAPGADGAPVRSAAPHAAAPPRRRRRADRTARRRPRATSANASAVLEALRARITLIWQTAEARVERPSVLDEVQSVLYVLAGTVYDVLPLVQRAVARTPRRRRTSDCASARGWAATATAIRPSRPTSRAPRRDWRARPCCGATAKRSRRSAAT